MKIIRGNFLFSKNISVLAGQHIFFQFAGEQHGFRKAENIQASLDGEFYFFGKVLGFKPADKGIEVRWKYYC